MDGPDGKGCSARVAALVGQAANARLTHPMLAWQEPCLIRNHLADWAGEVNRIAGCYKRGLFQFDSHEESLVSAWECEVGDYRAYPGLEDACCGAMIDSDCSTMIL